MARSSQTTLFRDFLLLGAFVAMVLFSLSVWVVYESYEERSRQITNRLENEAVRIDRTLIIEIENAAYLLESLARQISHYGDPDKEKIAQLLRSFYQDGYSNANVFSWINENQSLIASSDRGILAQPIDVSDRGYVKKALITPWQPHIGRPIEGRISRRYIVPVSMGITNYEGEYLGSLLIGIDLYHLTRKLKREMKDDGISFAVTNSSFTLLMEASEKENFFDDYFDKKRLNRMDFIAKPSGLYSKASLFGNEGIYSFYEHSLQYPFVMFLGYTNPDDGAAVQRILLPRFVQLFVILLFVASILWIVRLRVTQPVATLAERAKQVLHGRRLEEQSEVRGPAEVMVLSDQLDKIASYLRERQRIEEELLAKNRTLMNVRESAVLTNKVKAQFLEEIAQELQRPTIAVLERAEAIQGQHFGTIQNERYIDQAAAIHGNSGHILDLINEIRTISEAETGLIALNEKPLSIPFVVKKAARIFKEKSGYHDVEVELKIADHLPKLYADELRMKQIVLNLLNGAASKLAAGERITLHAHMLHGSMVLSVQFAPQVEGKTKQPLKAFSAALSLHRRGQQEESNQQRPLHRESTGGLGFILTRLLVALHEGEAEMRTRPNKGMEMIVRFPEKRVVRG